MTDGADTYGDAEDCEVLALKDFELGVTEFRLRDGSADGVSDGAEVGAAIGDEVGLVTARWSLWPAMQW